MVVDVALLLTLGIWLERRMGSIWYAVVGLGSAWIGGALSVGFASVIRGLDATWAEGLSHQYVSGITGFFVGAAMAASVQMDALWRRRVRIGVLVVLGTSVAFTGSLESVAATLAALVGWAGGAWLWREERDTRPLVGVPKEGRVIIALVVAGVAIGSLMALRSTEMIGVLAHARGDLTTHVDEQQVAQICDTSGLQGQCAHMSYLLRSSGLGARLLTVMPIAAQLALAWGLRGGRRAAFWGTLALQAVTAGIAVAHYLVVARKVRGWETAAELLGFGTAGAPTARFIVPILIPVVLGVLVAVNHKLFTVRAATGTYRRYWAAVAASAGIALAIFVIGGMVARHTFTPEATVFGLVGDFFVRLLPAPALYLVTPQFQGVRTSINRAGKEGIKDVWTTWEECPKDLKDQIIAMSEQWAGEKALPEMGFTLGGIAELDDPPVRILAAVDEDGKLHGATSWMPVYEGGKTVGWTLDFMRRRDDGFPPVMQYMIARAAVWGKENGYEILSLSGAPLAHAELQGEGEAGSSAAYLDYILEILGKGLEPVYGFRSLLKFKSKFQPRYEPVFLTIPDLASLPQVGLAIGHAYLPNMTARDMVNLVGAVRGREK